MKRSPAILLPLALGLFMGIALLTQGTKPESEAAESRADQIIPSGRLAGTSPHAVLPAKAPGMPGMQAGRARALPPGFPGDSVQEQRFSMTLPDGRKAAGPISAIRHEDGQVATFEGRLASPEPGRFFFQRQTVPGVAGEWVGHILFDANEVGWKVEPTGPGGSPELVETHRDGVICFNYSVPPPLAAAGAEEAPQNHPTNIPIPSYQSVIPLQSLPGATGVIYLDFDGEQGPFPSWGDFDAAPSGASNSQVHEVWRMVSEDFQGFNLNITTDRKVFDNAPQGRRQQVVISPTTTAAPGAGGVAFIGSFNWSDSAVCWAFYSTGKSAAEVISHEIGHTLNLSHDGRISPSEDYYGGDGDGSTGWAPIMGVGYNKNLTQWSKGEYLSANQTQDDLAVIVSNNDVDYRADDAGDDLASARYLEIAANHSVSNEGIIESGPDVDAFRFATTGGVVTLNVNTVSSNPNLDILAELVEASTGSPVTSANPDLGINASISTTLPAGEYLLKVSGVGRGDPLGDGYTDYASLGSYLISGSVSGGVQPDRFTIAENAPFATTVGSVVARVGHGTSTLTWSIESGNNGGAFAIDPASGEITVAEPAELDFESLSLRWDDPSTIELFVKIADSANPALDESVRVVVTVGNVNEPPVVSGATLTLLERTRIGTSLLTVAATDGDRFDFPSFSITGGNADGWFAIDPGTGELRVNGSIEVAAQTPVALTVQVTDQGSPQQSATATVNLTIVNIATGYEPGGVMRTYFEGINGSSVSNLTSATAKWPNHPNSEEFLEDFDGAEHGDNFGSTVRGYLIPPVTGSYRFWISSDDASQLRLGSSASPASAVSIASVSSWTNRYSWPDSGNQMSGLVTLTGGQPYFIEARHKEGGGEDHVAVAWSGPGITKELLKGLYLVPYLQNYAPKIAPATFSIAEEAFPGQVVATVTATDVNAGDTLANFTITSGNTGGAFAIDPATGIITIAAPVLNHAATPSYTLTVQASDNGVPSLGASGTITVQVLPAGSFPDNGIYQQVWTGINGASLGALTGNASYPFRPNSVRTLGGFDSGENFADNYGSRVRALLTPPVTGEYTFHLSSDDDSRLLLGTGPSASTAVQIASITGWSGYDVWDRYPSQQSLPVTLVAGQQYYIETLQKEGGGGDHVRVAWTGPGIGAITVIPGTALQPFDLNTPPAFAATPAAFTITEGLASGSVVGTVAATDPEGESPVHAITEEWVPGVFSIEPATGRITVADPSQLSPGIHYLTVAAQDRGIGGRYPLRSVAKSVTITVLSNNQPPTFASAAFSLPATEDQALSAALSATDPDPGDLLTFTKVAGPGWLSVSPAGTLSGVPGNAQVGANVFTVRVTDPEGASDDALLTLTVANVNDAPVFLSESLTAGSAAEDEAFVASLAGAAGDIDPGDSFQYSKVSGPAWLTVAADGSLGGTPGNGEVGANVFTVRVTDVAGDFSQTTLSIGVANRNDAPQFAAASISGPAATEDEAYFASIASQASDPDAGDSRVFTKIAGPSWLTISPGGSLSGTPQNAEVGANLFTVRVTDAAGAFAESTLSIAVANAADAPVFAADPILRAGGTELEPYSAMSIAGTATDDDAGEVPLYSRVAGPDWLIVSPDGSLAGTPPSGSAGLNSFTVRATDPGGAFDEATVLIEIGAAGLPLPWDESGIGSALAGSTTVEPGGIQLSGSGLLKGRNDALHFVWQPLGTGGSITARIDAFDGTGPDSRAGVMIRDTLATNSRHVFMGMTGDGGFRWVRRTGFNGNTSTSSSGSGTRPDAWVRLVRSGNRITAFKSPDGTVWTEVGSLTAALPQTCYFGLAIASGSTAAPATASFSHITVNP
jgi:hypothetical protein